MAKSKRHSLNNLEDYKLKGPVRRVEQQPYTAIAKSGFIIRGEIQKERSYAKYFILCFNENGKKTEEYITYYKDHQMKYVYNEKGLEVEYNDLEQGVLKSRMFYEYNNIGEISKLTHTDAEGNVINSSSIREYDKNGFLNKVMSYDKDNVLKTEEVLTNNEKGKKTEQIRSKADGSIELWIKYILNEYGDATETIYLKADGSIDKHEKNTYEYDAEGNMIGANGKKYIHEYYSYLEIEHDQYGNWISRIEFLKNRPMAFHFRKISYYGESEAGKDFSYFENIDKVPYDKEKLINFGLKDYNLYDTKYKKITTETMFDAEDLEWISEGCSIDKFPIIRYYALLNNDIPSVSYFYEDDGDALKLIDELRDGMETKILHSYSFFNPVTGDNELKSYVLGFPNKQYLLKVDEIYMYEDSQYDLPEYFLPEYPIRKKGYVYIGQIELFHPSDFSGKREEHFENLLLEYICECRLDEKPEQPEIRMIEVSGHNNYYLKPYPLNDNFTINDLDMHYGFGFEKFHNDLMDRFQKGSYGLVLLHGEPGTGKTYYIRHLLRKMPDSDKVVIYMPPNMVEYIVDPVFMTFLTKEITRLSKDGYTCILLIEDAEPLLASRSETGRVIGVSNLLNLTDGLLNDLLKLQIICTFNVKIKELDKALLRPGRLIARKEFKAMSMIDANRLAQQLGIKHRFIKPATLAEVYALLKDKNTLIHTQVDNNEY